MSETVKCLIGREKLHHHQQKENVLLVTFWSSCISNRVTFEKEVGYTPKFQAGVPDTLLCKEGSPRGINFYRERRILGRASYSFMF